MLGPKSRIHRANRPTTALTGVANRGLVVKGGSVTEADPAVDGHQNPRLLAIVLAGGSSRRMGGEDKLALTLADQTLLDLAIDAVAGADQVIAVGPQRHTNREVRWARENPPGGGPVAAISAGLSAANVLRSDAVFVAVLAGDMPLAASGVDGLLVVIKESDADVAIAVGEDGRDQPLLAIWRRRSLSSVLARYDSTHGLSARSLLEDVNVARVPVPPDAILDCDEPQDLQRVAALLREREGH